MNDPAPTPPSDTPRTDALWKATYPRDRNEYQFADFARQLERELSTLKARCDELERALDDQRHIWMNTNNAKVEAEARLQQSEQALREARRLVSYVCAHSSAKPLLSDGFLMDAIRLVGEIEKITPVRAALDAASGVKA